MSDRIGRWLVMQLFGIFLVSLQAVCWFVGRELYADEVDRLRTRSYLLRWKRDRGMIRNPFAPIEFVAAMTPGILLALFGNLSPWRLQLGLTFVLLLAGAAAELSLGFWRSKKGFVQF